MKSKNSNQKNKSLFSLFDIGWNQNKSIRLDKTKEKEKENVGNNGNVVTLQCTRHATISTTYITTHNLNVFFCFDGFSSLGIC